MLNHTIKLATLLFTVLSMTACFFNENGSTLIDNPTSEAISVTIDDKTYNVSAGQSLKIDISEDKPHILSCPQSGLENIQLSFEDAGTKIGVINPTKSKYVVYNIIFTEKDLSSKFKPYNIEGREIYSLLGEPELTTDLFIPDKTQGRGNLDNNIPKTLDYNRLNQDYTFLSRIFRLDDFFKYYDENNN